MSPTGKSYSFRSFVRACVRAGEARRGEAVCGRETMCLPWLGRGSAKSPPAWRSGARALPPVPLALWRGVTDDLVKSRSEHAAVRLTTQCMPCGAQMHPCLWRAVTDDLVKSRSEHAAVRLTTQCVPCSGSRSCLLYTSPSPRDLSTSRMPSSA